MARCCTGAWLDQSFTRYSHKGFRLVVVTSLARMRRILIATTALFFTPVLAGATTIHFDDFQETTRVTTYYAPQGLSNITNGAVYVVVQAQWGMRDFLVIQEMET